MGWAVAPPRYCGCGQGGCIQGLLWDRPAGARLGAGLPGLAQFPGNWTRILLRLHCSRESTQTERPRARISSVQMSGVLTQCLCVLCPGRMWPQRWSWNRSDLSVTLVCYPCFLGEAWHSRICSALSALVCSAWWDLAQSRGLWAMEAGITALRGMGSELWASGTPCPGAAFPRFKVLE